MTFNPTGAKQVVKSKYDKDEINYYHLKINPSILAKFKRLILPDYFGKGNIQILEADYLKFISKIRKHFKIQQIDGVVCVRGKLRNLLSDGDKTQKLTF